MDKKNEVKKEELEKVSGGIIVPSMTWFQCNDCGARWETNRPDVCYKCYKCNSSNTKKI